MANIIISKNNFDSHIDFSEFDDNIDDLTNDDNIDSLYTNKNGSKILYDDKTMLYYKTMRFRRMDPIFQIDIDEDKCFKFYDQWNAYTGERQGTDPYGPLCFHPDSLIKYFYENRLNNLWVNESQQNDEYYEGYYDVAVGAGHDIYIQSRGYNPEKYLFRLPIIDCYWSLDINNEAIVTMGPVLTDQEIKQIDDLAKKHGSFYHNQFKAQRPSLQLIKQLYDTAITKTPSINTSSNISSSDKLNELYAKANRSAVDKLRMIIG